jgi:hypothetical protein
MIRAGIFLLSLTASQLYGIDVKAKKAMAIDDYVFFESAIHPNLLLILGKTETVITSVTDNTTTSGQPIKTYALQTRWIDIVAERRAALNRAIAENQEWETFGKDFQDIESKYCKFLIADADIKVSQGDRDRTLTSRGTLCSYVVHTKGGADAKLESAVKSNRAIDSGLGLVKLISDGGKKDLLDAYQLSEKLKWILANDDKVLTEKQAAFYLGAALIKYEPDSFVKEIDDLFKSDNEKDLYAAFNKTFDMLYRPAAANGKNYKFHALSALTPVSVDAQKIITFDPQIKE